MNNSKLTKEQIEKIQAKIDRAEKSGIAKKNNLKKKCFLNLKRD